MPTRVQIPRLAFGARIGAVKEDVIRIEQRSKLRNKRKWKIFASKYRSKYTEGM
jgi:hypothetical protein